jgi:hypothetical protein
MQAWYSRAVRGAARSRPRSSGAAVTLFDSCALCRRLWLTLDLSTVGLSHTLPSRLRAGLSTAHALSLPDLLRNVVDAPHAGTRAVECISLISLNTSPLTVFCVCIRSTEP